MRANCPHISPGRFHSLSLLTALSEDAVTLLVKAELICTSHFWVVGGFFLKKKSSSLTHLLLPSPFKELSSSRFIFAEYEFRVLGNKPTRDTFKRKTSSHFWHSAWANKSLSEHFYLPPSFLAPAFLWAESHLSKFCSGNKEKTQYSYSTSC